MVALSVVIPATDARPTLARAVAAAEQALAEVDELIVVDGPPGLGPAAARNLGSQRATRDVVVFLDSDVEVHPDAFTLIRAAVWAAPGSSCCPRRDVALRLKRPGHHPGRARRSRNARSQSGT